MSVQLPLGRRDTIAERLDGGAAVVAADLAVEFEVSEDAIRRDLRALAAEGRCRRVYGGALPVGPAPRALPARIDQDPARKSALARQAVASIVAGEFLFLDAGSTNLAIVAHLPVDQALTVATNSVDIASAVLRRPGLRLLVIGGEVDATVGGCVDAAAVQTIGGLNIDRCFLGACSIDIERGISADIRADAVFKRALLAAARRCVVLALNEKFGVRAPHRVCALADIERVVVEHDAPAAAVKALKAARIKLATAVRAE